MVIVITPAVIIFGYLAYKALEFGVGVWLEERAKAEFRRTELDPEIQARRAWHAANGAANELVYINGYWFWK